MWIFVEIKDKSFLLHAHKNKEDEFFVFVQREKRNRSLKMMKQKTEKIRHS